MALFSTSEAQYQRKLEAFFAGGQYMPALDLALKANRNYPLNPDFHLAICDCCMCLGDLEKAYEALKKGLALDNKRANLRVRELQLLAMWNPKFNTFDIKDGYQTAKMGCDISCGTLELELPKELRSIGNAAAGHLYNQLSEFGELLGKSKSEVLESKRLAVMNFQEAFLLNPLDRETGSVWHKSAGQYSRMKAEWDKAIQEEMNQK